MHLDSEDVAQIVNEVWSSMLGLPVEALALETPPTIDGGAVAGSVGVSGATECLICVEMSADAARLFGATMFGLDEADASNDDISDAIGELTNMVGGNIKSLLPEPSSLSLPVVAQGTSPTLKVPSAKKMLDATYMCGEYPLIVTVWNRVT
ncbi:chemotaxis protein CheX [Gephyromycinifex aptenodytis]|uniref:chemotaxis protein CheX n=1 Tax=Gephyromycinifex aptenodytis TaxID=2716227 RepID=UPI001447096E|nr:chemotaxis protein CheX [Gephyromycinifex aptenodytis]